MSKSCQLADNVETMKQLKRWYATSSLHIKQCLVPFLLASGFVTVSAEAAPYTPASDATVLVVLPYSRVTIAAQAAAEPVVVGDEERISRAQKLLELAYETSSEDAFGQAEALLAPWTHDVDFAAIPVDAQFMLAVIKQHNHEFAAAVLLLDNVLQQQPRHAAALLQRAQIHLVLGNYTESRQDCGKLLRLASTATVTNCLAQVEAVTGHAIETRTHLEQLAGRKEDLVHSDFVEVMITLATVTHRLDLVDETDNYYRMVLQESPDNLYAILQYTDFLLEQQRYGEVLELLTQLPLQQLTLELQVKKLEALRGSAMTAEYAAEYAQLEDVFAIAEARAGDLRKDFPNKEFARFLLQSPQTARQAVPAALANWQYQKEPGDLLLLVRAALAANSQDELEMARTWLAVTGLQDERINSLLSHDTSTAREGG